jgi:hypothetical protein
MIELTPLNPWPFRVSRTGYGESEVFNPPFGRGIDQFLNLASGGGLGAIGSGQDLPPLGIDFIEKGAGGQVTSITYGRIVKEDSHGFPAGNGSPMRSIPPLPARASSEIAGSRGGCEKRANFCAI